MFACIRLASYIGPVMGLYVGAALLVAMGIVVGVTAAIVWQHLSSKDASGKTRSNAESGNVFFALFGAVALLGAVGASTMAIMKGPVRSMAEVTKRTIAENSMIAASRLSVVASAQQATQDCDSDNYVEPLPWDGPVGAAPAGGGNLPASVGASRMDPWGTNYGYCAWDHGTAIDAAGCGGASQKRLRGENADNKAMLAVISAGPDHVFQTKCGDSPAYITKPAGSDDIVMQYTYAESQGIAGGLWMVKPGDLKTAEIDRNLEVKNNSNAVVMAFDQTTDTSKPSLKVDFLSKLTAAKKGVEMLSNIVLGDNWLSGDGDAEGIRIDASGNVGIGTASPAYRLDVLSDGGSIARFTGTNPSGAYIHVAASGATGAGLYANSQGKGGYLSYSGTSYDGWQFFAGGGTPEHVKMVIKNHGQVGIGTASPAYKLHVVDDSASARAIYGQSTATSGTNYGGYFQSDSTSGRAVYGAATATSGNTYGGYFESASDGGYGIVGHNSATTGNGIAIYGYSSTPGGAAIKGYATATTGNASGGSFETRSASGYGVRGGAAAGTGVTYGGYFYNNSPAGGGVYGSAGAASGNTYGGEFYSNSTSGTAVFGAATASSGNTWGGYFRSGSPNGRGVQGWATSGTGLGIGGYFLSYSDNGYGIQGSATHPTGVTYGGYFYAASPNGYGVYSNGRVHVQGNLTVSGTASAATPTAADHLTTKAYVDARVAAGTGFTETDPQVGT
ncbi:MAG: hypothetical protein ACTHKQ_25680, partial [Mesorhizobium sp.]